MGNDIELLNVNKELILSEKTNGFKIEKSKLLMFLKDLPSNIYHLAVIALASISEFFPGVVEKVPVVGYLVDLVAAYAKNYASQVVSDEFFDNVICPLFGIEVNFASPEYCSAFVQFTHHEGQYFQISMALKTIATFAMEHPGLVLAGGALLASWIVRLVTKILKRVNNSIKYNEMNDKQKEVYELLKEVLKKSKIIKKADNGDILVNDLNISYDIVENLRNFPDMLDQIKNILVNLNSAIDDKNITDYELYRIALEKSVFIFDQENDNLLNKKMHLVEDTEIKQK